jgi:hypothetical protein
MSVAIKKPSAGGRIAPGLIVDPRIGVVNELGSIFGAVAGAGQEKSATDLPNAVFTIDPRIFV